MDLLLAPSTPSEEEEEEKEEEEEGEGEGEEGEEGEKGEECRLERRGGGNGKVALCWAKSVQKREKSWLIWLLCTMERRQEDSKGVFLLNSQFCYMHCFPNFY